MRRTEFYKLSKGTVVNHKQFGESKVVLVRKNDGIMFECINYDGKKELESTPLKKFGLKNCFIETKASFVKKIK